MQVRRLRQLYWAFLLILFSFHIPLQSQTESPSFHYEQTTIPDLLRDLSTRLKAPVVFSDNFFNDRDLVTIQYKGEDLKLFIARVLSGTGLTVIKKNGVFIVFEDEVRWYQVHGFLTSAYSGEFLPFATIHCPDLGKVFSSNSDGFFNFYVPEGSLNMSIYYLGHETTSIELEVNSDLEINLALKSKNLLPEIIVDDAQEMPVSDEKTEFSYDQLMALATKTPGLGGSNDLLHTAKSLPGIQTGSGGIGGYFVRGGSSDQNLFLLDGVSIYNPLHSLGLSSIFTPHAVRNLQIYKSGFRPEYGDKSASVFDIKLKSGNLYEHHFEAGLNPQDGYLIAEGPIAKGKSSFFTYARTSTLFENFNEIIRKSLFEDDEGESTTRYFDVIGKLNLFASDKNRLYLTFYKGQDRILGSLEEEDEINDLEDNEETTLDWGNEVLSLRWQSLLNGSTLFHMSASRNKYFSDFTHLILEEETEDLGHLFYNKISSSNEDIEVRVDIDLNPSSGWRWKTGLSYLKKKFTPDFQILDEDSGELDQIEDFRPEDFDLVREPEVLSAQKWVHYFEGTWSPSGFNIRGGLRSSFFLNDEERFFHLQPRMSISLDRGHAGSWSVSVSRMIQYVHLLSSTEIHLPRDLWFPSSGQLPPEDTWHYNFSFSKPVDKVIKVKLDVFYKTTQNKSISTEALLNNTPNITDLFDHTGSTRNYGFELGLHLSKGPVRSQVGYSWNQFNWTFPNLNLGQSFAYQFERRHEFKTLTSWQLSNYLTLGISTYLSSGHPLLVSSYVDPRLGLDPVEIDSPGQKNHSRTPWQHRLDLSLSYEREALGLFHLLKLNIYNVYAFDSPLFYTTDEVSVPYELTPNFSIPFLPSLSYTIKF